jgi:hypothetical protein
MPALALTSAKETMVNHLNGFHHSTVDGARIEWDFCSCGNIFQVRDLCAHKGTMFSRGGCKHVFKLWGFPLIVILDMDTWFIGWFWMKLFHLVGMKSLMSSRHDSQNDRKIEKINCLLENYLRNFMQED